MTDLTPEQIAAYWQAYEDLIELRARNIWQDADLARHWAEHGKAEGRVLPDPDTFPADWSDTLFFDQHRDSYRWWWDKGILPGGAPRAATEAWRLADAGRISRNERVRANSAMSPEALEQVAAHTRAWPGSGPLHEMLHHKVEWAGHEAIGVLPLLLVAREMADEGVDDVILLPWLESGGAELVGHWHYRASLAAGRRPLIVLTDRSVITPRFAQAGLRVLDIPGLLDAQGGPKYGGQTVTFRAEIVASVIEEMAPDRLHLIHAFAGYQALALPATRSRIRAACRRIDVSAFCPHIHADGRRDGYFRQIPDLAPVVDLFIFDNRWFRDEMVSTFGLPPAQSAVLAYPVEPVSPVTPAPDGCRKVIWASRLDAQKNPQVLAPIAAALPDLEFVVMGREVMGDTSVNWDAMPGNVTRAGEFFSPDDLPLDQVFAFLYTSRFDGMPNILLEIAARGVPVVTPPVGGVPDFFGADWPLYAQNPDDVAGYVRALGALVENPGLRQQMRAQQLDLLARDRSLAVFFDSVGALGSALRGGSGDDMGE